MRATRAIPALPASVSRALRTLGADVSTARRRRRLTMAMMAERAFVSRPTIARVEKGDAGVSLGLYATVLFVLGMADRLAKLGDPGEDAAGRMLEDEQLPKRVRLPHARKAAP
jgi:transcriptional regulator with XRE-family HTH domain